MEISRRAYPSDVTDAEWNVLLPYLLLVREDAGQRQYPLRELLNALRFYRAYGLHLALLTPRFTALGRVLPAVGPLARRPRVRSPH